MRISKRLANKLGLTKSDVDRETINRHKEKIERKVAALTGAKISRPAVITSPKKEALSLEKRGALYVLKMD